MSNMDWFIVGIIVVGFLIWLISKRLLYMLVYFALFSVGSFIYRLSNNYSIGDAFMSSFGLIDILVLILAIVLLIDRIKNRKADH